MITHAAISSRGRGRKGFELSASPSYIVRLVSKKSNTHLARRDANRLIWASAPGLTVLPGQRLWKPPEKWFPHPPTPYSTASAEWTRTGCLTEPKKLTRSPRTFEFFKKFWKGRQSRSRRHLEHQTDETGKEFLLSYYNSTTKYTEQRKYIENAREASSHIQRQACQNNRFLHRNFKSQESL